LIIREYIKIFKEFDALLSPTTKIPAPKISEVIGRELEYRDVLIGNTEIFNAVNAPSISLPVSMINDLSIGLMVSGEPYADGKVLDIAERILGVVEFIKK
jgi:aspartyl-tRNA(Asn)/glutamyl-tRNA(Gln) amidotransferase subunit A